MSRIAVFGLTLIAVMMANAVGHAQSQSPVPPRLSVPKALSLQNNPAALSQFSSQLPRRTAGSPQAAKTTPKVTPQVTSPTFGGTWQTVTQAPAGGLTNPLLLTDGTVIFLDYLTGSWYKLTPDNFGRYVDGTWSQIASLPSGYAPEYFASAVLPDGRVLIMGGEYNGNYRRRQRGVDQSRCDLRSDRQYLDIGIAAERLWLDQYRQYGLQWRYWGRCEHSAAQRHLHAQRHLREPTG